MSWAYHPELLATPVPRYTSYPTAAEFHDGIGASDMEQALAAVPAAAPISLYLHIPYCHDICWYCGCNTGAANKAQRLAGYLDSLHAEVDLVAARLGGRGRPVRIAFGGGSPNAIAPDDFLALLTLVRDRFSAHQARVSIELDPRSLGGDWFQAIAAAGVERASLGVQTLVPRVQEAIGRVQPEPLIRSAVAKLRRAGVASINFDLMYGLPHQGLAELHSTLLAAADMKPERLALFGYAHVPHLIPRQRRIDGSSLPDAAARFAQAKFGHRLLTSLGYQPVGFDHFALHEDALAVAARTGTLRRNFQGFTDDPAEILIGLGASAISNFPDRIVQNEKNAGRYRMLASAGQLPAARGLIRSGEDRVRGRIVESILCRGEADISALCLGDVLEDIRPFRERGLVTISGSRLQLGPDALPYARAIAAAFDSYRQPDAQRFSNAI